MVVEDVDQRPRPPQQHQCLERVLRGQTVDLRDLKQLGLQRLQVVKVPGVHRGGPQDVVHREPEPLLPVESGLRLGHGVVLLARFEILHQKVDELLLRILEVETLACRGQDLEPMLAVDAVLAHGHQLAPRIIFPELPQRVVLVEAHAPDPDPIVLEAFLQVAPVDRFAHVFDGFLATPLQGVGLPLQLRAHVFHHQVGRHDRMLLRLDIALAGIAAPIAAAEGRDPPAQLVVALALDGLPQPLAGLGAGGALVLPHHQPIQRPFHEGHHGRGEHVDGPHVLFPIW
mmetsp:Transcript_1172/g.3439  ORF Transcript_1172/g.3439 Transcript_1172/m.3439 type:complete len:286 (+) Transcript_1172:1226-2083(+)